MAHPGYGTWVQSDQKTHLDLRQDVVALTAALVDIPSESLHEAVIADAVEQALQKVGHLQVSRHDNTIVARTDLGRPRRVVIAGHLDTVPANSNLPHRLEDDRLYGLGACDMKGGVAVALKLAHDLAEPELDVTYLFYEAEEISAEHNGLAKLAIANPHVLQADFAILMEPSNAGVEAGCQGTLRAHVIAAGARAHSARAWMGDNAIHNAAEILERLGRYRPREVEVEGLVYREGMNAVLINGGVAGNVIPDRCVVTINYRYAPTLSEAEAQTHLRELFEGFDVEIDDNAGGAMPGTSHPDVESFIQATGSAANPKFGWTDVARFSALGIPALNFGPGNPSLAHSQGEYVTVADLNHCEQALRAWLSQSST